MTTGSSANQSPVPRQDKRILDTLVADKYKGRKQIQPRKEKQKKSGDKEFAPKH